MKRYLPLFIIVLCIVSMWSIYLKVANKVTIATVVSSSYEDVLETEAVFVRNEYPIKVDGEGYFRNSVASGSKVHKGQSVGYYYIGEPDKDLVSRLNMVNEKLKTAIASQGTADAMVDDTISIDNKIASLAKQISELSSLGEQDDINKLRAQIDVLLERKAAIAASGTVSSKTSVIETLTQQKNELEASLAGNKTDLYAPAPGVFSSTADGLEQTLTPESIKTMTPDTLQEIIGRKEYVVDKSVYPYNLCKVIDNSEWILSFVCDEKKAEGIKKGSEIEVRFTNEGNVTETCVVKEISDAQNGKVVLSLKGDIEFFNMQGIRKTNVEVVLKKYKGLRVPVGALKNEAGKDVVYVSTGIEKQPKYVNVLYKNNDIAIIEENNAAEGALLLYDEVVLE